MHLSGESVTGSRLNARDTPLQNSDKRQINNNVEKMLIDHWKAFLCKCLHVKTASHDQNQEHNSCFSRARPSLYRRGEYINLGWQNKLHSLTSSKKRSKFHWTYQSVACCVDTEVWHCAYLRNRLVLVWRKSETSAHIINIVFYSV